MKTPSGRAARKAARPLEIIDAAYGEFVEFGYERARVERIAQAIDVTKGTIYFYFNGKEALFRAVVTEYIRRTRQAIADDHATLTGTPTERVIDFLWRFYRRLSTERSGWELLGLLIREGSHFPDLVDLNNSELIDPMLAEWKAILADGVLAGEFGPQAAADRVPELVMAPALWLALSSLMADRNPVDIERVYRSHVDLLIKGLLSPSP